MKSPLKAKPLRNPGDSVQESLDDLLLSEVLYHMLVATVLVILAGIEWLRWYNQNPPNPWLYSFAAVAYGIFAILKVRRAKNKAKSLKLGRDGERAVGQYLEYLRESGAKVFHDIPGESFNLDHVVIHTSGIYVIEIKSRSKPDSGSPEIVFDGESVALLGRNPDSAPITQVRAASSWLAQLIEESSGRKCSIQPVIAFPGWFIKRTTEAKRSDVWAINPKALPAFIQNSQEALSREDVNLFAYHLSRYIRSAQ